MSYICKNCVKTGLLSISIGIPTCYSGSSLVRTIFSLRNSKCMENVPIRVVADNISLAVDNKFELAKMNVSYIWNDEQGSQLKKLAQIVSFVNEDIFVFTQDDVLFSPDTLLNIKSAFEVDPNLTMVSTAILPEKNVSLISRSLSSMLRIVFKIARSWNSGDNYLSSSGRCLAFRTSFLKSFRIPEDIVNADAFFYFENLRLGGKFRLLDDSPVYIHTPDSIHEQLRPSSRFQFSYNEIAPLFLFDLKYYYRIPKLLILHAVFLEVLRFPVQVIIYCFVFVYTRSFRQKRSVVSNTLWQLDLSTKQN
jgi:hypothetical protein